MNEANDRYISKFFVLFHLAILFSFVICIGVFTYGFITGDLFKIAAIILETLK